jgi:hypothetical protein
MKREREADAEAEDAVKVEPKVEPKAESEQGATPESETAATTKKQKIEAKDARGAEVLTSLKDLRFSSAGPLIAKETVDQTWFLTAERLAGIIRSGGGAYKDAITAKTDFVILGDVAREHTKKTADTWTGSKKQADLSKHSSEVQTLTFDEFLDRFHIRNLCVGSCNIATFKSDPMRKRKAKRPVPPGKDRTRGILSANTLVHISSQTGAVSMMLVRQTFSDPSEWCKQHKEGQGDFDAELCGICAAESGAAVCHNCTAGEDFLLCGTCCGDCCKCSMYND